LSLSRDHEVTSSWFLSSRSACVVARSPVDESSRPPLAVHARDLLGPVQFPLLRLDSDVLGSGTTSQPGVRSSVVQAGIERGERDVMRPTASTRCARPSLSWMSPRPQAFGEEEELCAKHRSLPSHATKAHTTSSRNCQCRVASKVPLGDFNALQCVQQEELWEKCLSDGREEGV